MIVISSALALSVSPRDPTNANNPLIGYRNMIAANGIAATSAAIGAPASLIGNPSTAERWRAAVLGPQTITAEIFPDSAIDYVGIAGHNLGSAGITISISGSIADGEPVELVPEMMLPGDGPAMFRFPAQNFDRVTIALGGGAAPAAVAVLYVGPLLVLQRRIQVGHTPMPMGRRVQVTNARSESGNFLGRIVTGESTETEIDLQNLTPAWYREHMDPFVVAAQVRPFFFAWRPAKYPREVGFAWLTNDPIPTNQRSNGMMSVGLELSGIAR